MLDYILYLGGILWITTALFYWWQQERKPVSIKYKYHPKVSVIISAFNEEKDIRYALDSVCALNYPDFEIIVVNDGSTDNTAKILHEYVGKKRIRKINKLENQGKALAVDDALMCSNGEIILVIDADAVVHPDLLNRLIPHFEQENVGAVAGNPRVKNVNNFLTRMQFIEYTSIISMIRRSQRIWGRIMAVSGVLFAVRRSAFVDVGGFTPAAATEDIDLTWKLQKKFWDVLYESSAIAWVKVPFTYMSFFRQRMRWSRGLMQVLHRHSDIILHWKYRRMWPVFIENACSTLWALLFVIHASLWLLTTPLMQMERYLGTSLWPGIWGIVIATVTIVLCTVGHLLDRKYDPNILRYLPYAIYYPIYYWILLAFIAVIEIPALFVKITVRSVWKTER
jgi:biofilm PGA synthesis N-glycosyltransferase PgaC